MTLLMSPMVTDPPYKPRLFLTGDTWANAKSERQRDMVKESLFGRKLERATKETGKITNRTEKVDTCLEMALSTRANSIMTYLKVQEYSFLRTGFGTKASLKMEKEKAMAKNRMQMVPRARVSTKTT
jgi:hypothetical protein